ncbi:MAG: tyrosine-type recombinase/integrase [Dechloromonas sp.]|uniref:Tyrosine-type recombinase/integrase n=1 Tax=Candidatus Dechloromonas phosphorivorans TaxID=2899244 RepID=A0A935JZ96_9RHOO|nr:tyrosine-type recombinase/integrase [Candidatus Dechloromonas phosphorivorans]
MSNSINFTKEALQGLSTPKAGGRAVYLDAKTTGLQIRVTDTGSKTFSVYRRMKGGQPERITLGRFPAMTIEQARKQAARINAEIEEGSNPAQVKRAIRAELTFAELFKEYGERHGNKKKSWRTDQSLYENHLQGIASRKVSAISRESISRILSELDKEGKAGATINNVRALVSSIYGRAIEWGYATSNPVVGIKTRTKVKRDRFLQTDELPRFFQSLAAEQNETIRAYILLALLTGARRANLLAMRWKEINQTESVWRIPVTKNGTPQNVTLSPEALTILKARKKEAENGEEFVFPGNGTSGHMEEPKKGVIRVMERAGIPYGRKIPDGVTLHDLRRTLGSWQAKTGASLVIIGKSLNHLSPQTTAIYARLDLDPVRQSVNTATAAMMEAAGENSTATIIPIGKRTAA